MSDPMNIVVIVADTFRTSFLGAYGNDWIHTPNLDQFAEEGVRFTNAHPECLPTIPDEANPFTPDVESSPLETTVPFPGTMSILPDGSLCRLMRAQSPRLLYRVVITQVSLPMFPITLSPGE